MLRERGMCAFITAVPITKLFAWEEGDSRGHVLQETLQQTVSRATQPGPVSPGGGEQAQRHHPARASHQSLGKVFAM